jgi:hypothetical protein
VLLWLGEVLDPLFENGATMCLHHFKQSLPAFVTALGEVLESLFAIQVLDGRCQE